MVEALKETLKKKIKDQIIINRKQGKYLKIKRKLKFAVTLFWLNLTAILKKNAIRVPIYGSLIAP